MQDDGTYFHFLHYKNETTTNSLISSHLHLIHFLLMCDSSAVTLLHGRLDVLMVPYIMILFLPGCDTV